jgi:ketosteroid isomerase-like protein
MSRENVEAYTRAVEAANRRDMDALLADFHPDVEWHSALVGLGAEVYRGEDGVREMFSDLDENLTSALFEVSEIHDLGDRVLALGRLRARGHDSGVQTESSFNQLVDFKDGKVIRLRSFLDRKEAVEAAGLTE